MKRLGLDFGTTNSIISFVNSAGAVEVYQFGGVNNSGYIPSFLSIDKEEGDINIGIPAKSRIDNDDYEVFSNFKLFLAENDQEKLKANGYSHHQPSWVAEQYIDTIIKAYKKEMRIDCIESLVITVPEIWVKEGQHKEREILKAICDKLGLPLIKLLSEPVAATTYFADAYRKQNAGKNFSGHVLVCDYGGGTLDLSLSKIDNDTVTTMYNTGRGHSGNGLGVGGVGYDHAVIEMLKTKAAPSSFTEKPIEKLRIDFERIKIDEAEEIKKELSLYLRDKNFFNKSKLKMDGIELSPNILYDAFERVVLPSLSASLEDIKKFILDHNIDIDDSGAFRLVFAGGFSSFYLVRKTVLNAFGINEESDPRNDQCFTLTDTALAISKGAALIAHNDFKVEYVCPIDIGVIVTEVTTGKRREISILKKGVLINKYRKPIFAGEKFIINENPDKDTMMTFFYEKNGHRVDNKISVLSHDLLPNANKANYWDVGFSVDEDLMFYFHAKDKDNSISTVQLGSVLQASEKV